MSITVFTDGGARGNPGPAGIGVVIQNGDETHEVKKFLGDKLTNNWAEYEAVVLALEALQRLGLADRSIEFKLDSELVQRQLTGAYKVKDATLKTQYHKVRELLDAFGAVHFTHIRREQNAEADRLVNEAIDEAGY